MQWLVTAEAQQIWVDRGGALSANVNVTEYPDETASRLADLAKSAQTFRFDAGDLMGGEINSAFFAAMVSFVDNPDNLDSILQNLDEVTESSMAQ
jgi:alpha-glucoside transport system substrate-binding protein